jgi:hypothetical protein
MTQYQGSPLNQYKYNGGNIDEVSGEPALIGGFPIQNLIGLSYGGLSGGGGQSGGNEIHNKFMNLIVPAGLIIEEDPKSLIGGKNTVYKTHDANQEIDNELFNKLFGDVATTTKSKKQTKKLGNRRFP